MFFIRLMTALAVVAVIFLLHAQKAALPSEMENEQILGINKEPCHTKLMPDKDRAETLKADRRASTWTRSLNGQWKFHWVPRPEEHPVDFYKPDFDVTAWKEIAVPSNMEAQGHDRPITPNLLIHSRRTGRGSLVSRPKITQPILNVILSAAIAADSRYLPTGMVRSHSRSTWYPPTRRKFSYVIRLLAAGDRNYGDAARIAVPGEAIPTLQSQL